MYDPALTFNFVEDKSKEIRLLPPTPPAGLDGPEWEEPAHPPIPPDDVGPTIQEWNSDYKRRADAAIAQKQARAARYTRGAVVDVDRMQELAEEVRQRHKDFVWDQLGDPRMHRVVVPGQAEQPGFHGKSATEVVHERLNKAGNISVHSFDWAGIAPRYRVAGKLIFFRDHKSRIKDYVDSVTHKDAWGNEVVDMRHLERLAHGRATRPRPREQSSAAETPLDTPRSSVMSSPRPRSAMGALQRKRPGAGRVSVASQPVETPRESPRTRRRSVLLSPPTSPSSAGTGPAGRPLSALGALFRRSRTGETMGSSPSHKSRQTIVLSVDAAALQQSTAAVMMTPEMREFAHRVAVRELSPETRREYDVLHTARTIVEEPPGAQPRGRGDKRRGRGRRRAAGGGPAGAGQEGGEQPEAG